VGAVARAHAWYIHLSITIRLVTFSSCGISRIGASGRTARTLHGAFLHDVRGHAAEHHVMRASMSMRSHRDEIDVVAPRVTHDFRKRRSLFNCISARKSSHAFVSTACSICACGTIMRGLCDQP
jgi:hypothetical protein